MGNIGNSWQKMQCHSCHPVVLGLVIYFTITASRFPKRPFHLKWCGGGMVWKKCWPPSLDSEFLEFPYPWIQNFIQMWNLLNEAQSPCPWILNVEDPPNSKLPSTHPPIPLPLQFSNGIALTLYMFLIHHNPLVCVHDRSHAVWDKMYISEMVPTAILSFLFILHELHGEHAMLAQCNVHLLPLFKLKLQRKQNRIQLWVFCSRKITIQWCKYTLSKSTEKRNFWICGQTSHSDQTNRPHLSIDGLLSNYFQITFNPLRLNSQ